MNVLDVNSVNLRNVYSSAQGHTIGQAGTTGNQSAMPTVNASPTNADAQTHQALTIGGQANPVIGGIVFLALIVGLSFLAKRVGSVDEFKNVRVSPYNVLIISMATVIGMPVWKYLFTRFPIPGVSTWVASA
jgi:hypothetical protein